VITSDDQAEQQCKNGKTQAQDFEITHDESPSRVY